MVIEQTTDALLQLMYDELRGLASRQLLAERRNHTLQITALVHETYLRLRGTDASDTQWVNRYQFLAAAAEAMRRILVDHARARTTLKRGAGFGRVPLGELEVPLPLPADDLLALHEALRTLEAEDPPKAELVKLRVFAGFTLEQAAAALEISRATASRHWALAKLRLQSLMQ